MRRLPRLRSAAPAGFASLSTPSGALRAAPACALSSVATNNTTTTTGSRTSPILPSQRYLSTSTPIRAAQPPTSQPEANTTTTPVSEADALPSEAELESLEYDTYETDPPEISTPLLYPSTLTTAPSPTDVTDPSYKPAETADNLEEVGGLAGWWDEPSHWGTSALDGSAQGVEGYVRSVTGRFGPATGVVSDPAMLEALARRAVVEVLALGGKRKVVLERLFKVTEDGEEEMRIGAALRARLREVEGEGDRKAEVVRADGGRVRAAIARVLKSSAAEVEEGQEAEVAEDADLKEPAAEEAAPKTVRYLTPETAAELIQSWGHKWKKAELRDPVTKFYIAKRIQQLTGRRIPDGKLLAITTIDKLIKELVVPPKPLKLAELVETKGAFKDLPNVRVFPRRVTPIDKEQMVGRWKIIVKELEKRDLPLTGTGEHGAPIEKKWIEGRA